jgi:hypothetical protein
VQPRQDGSLILRGRFDKSSVRQFLEDARNILEAAEAVSASAGALTEFTILISAEGSIEMLAGSDWPLERLLQERGARTVYRVSEQRGKVTLEGRCGRQSCRLEAVTPAETARRLLAASRGESLAQTEVRATIPHRGTGIQPVRQTFLGLSPRAATAGPPRAGAWPLLRAGWG